MAVSIKKPMLIQSLITQSGGVIKASTSVPGYTVSYDDRVPLEALDASVQLNIDGASSSASIRLATGTNVDGRAYIEMYTVQGSAGIFRTRSPQIGYGSQNTTLQLEHAVNEIGDFLVTDKIEKEMTLKDAMKKIFEYYGKKSSMWKLGTVETPKDPNANDKNEEQYTKCVLSVDYDNCLDAIESIMEQYPYMMLTFNFSSLPWKLNVKNKPTLSTAQGRLSRNVKSATVIRDDSELFTRVYAQKKDGKMYKHDAMSFYRKKYGVIETVISAPNDTDAIWEQTVKSYLKTHKKPRYSITIDGIELSNITGESLDKLTLGKLMDLALPDYKTTISEVITGVSFPSVYKNPNSCTVTLNAEEDKVIKYIKKAQKTAGKAARSAASIGSTVVRDADVKDNVLILTKADGTVINFSKAVTLKGTWAGGKYTVSATQKNLNTKTNKVEEKEVKKIFTVLNGIVLQANKSPSLYGTYSLKIPLKVMYNNSGYKGNTEYMQDVIVSAKVVYDAGVKKGWREANDALVMPSKNTSSAKMKVIVPSSNLHQTSTYEYTVSVDNDNAYIKNATGTVVAQCSNTAYNNGKKAATVSLTHGAVTEDSNYQKHVKYTAANTSNTSNKQEVEFYLVKSGNRSQLRTGSASGTLIMEIYNT